MLGQTAVDAKSNEITAIPELLTMLDIENSIITLDAMVCQREIAKQIIQKKADYMLALKGNHSGMQDELAAWWHKIEREGLNDKNYDEHSDISSGHGRIKTRTCQQMQIESKWLSKAYRWSGLNSIIKINSEVIEKSTGKKTVETRWYISSLALNAEQALDAVRSHWQVESTHWMLDDEYRSTLLKSGIKMRLCSC